MPVIDGIDAIAAFRIMKKDDPTGAILVVSAVPFEKTRKIMIEEGALAYVIEPFNQSSFEQARTQLLRAFPELETH